MKRRQFVARAGAAAFVWPVAARAQQAMPVLGFLNGQSLNNFGHLLAAFREGLSEIGYAEGRNVSIEYRWADGQAERMPAMAAELVRRQVAAIVAGGGAHIAAIAATSTIPIVCTFGSDPVKDGLVASFNRPGGNVTGAIIFAANLEAKRLELAHELAPPGTFVGVIMDPFARGSEEQLQEMQSAARTLARQILVMRVGTEADIETTFAKLREARVGAVSVTAGPFNYSKRAQFIAHAAQSAIPAIYENRETAMTGGLMSYGTSILSIYRQIGVYTGRVLKGEKPSDLPIVRPTKFEMVVNLKTAKALGIEIPRTILERADEVIE